MNDKEKKAIEYTENCLMKITMGIDCEFDVNILDTLLNIIKKLQKDNEELKKDYYNVINKIENKIDILDIAISECIYIDDDDKAYKKAVEKDKLCLLNQKRTLQELLEGGQS
jgi:hypothetical protein